uniref:Oligomycin sensitivity conferral protein n=1 Tax=Ascaris lumbricoides TaxID=6252 RepID=A0A0M3HWZ8_ASCLU
LEVHGIEGRYASALYSAAYKQKKLDIVDKDFTAVREVYKTNPKFRVRVFVSFPHLFPRFSSLREPGMHSKSILNTLREIDIEWFLGCKLDGERKCAWQ